MTSTRLPAFTLVTLALGLFAWSVLLLATPGGSRPMEWTQLVLAVVGLGTGGYALYRGRGAEVIRWALTGVAGFGALVVIGLTADGTSSRTWVRLGWAALIAGHLASPLVWWTAPRARRAMVIGGGVAGLALIAGGLGITLNCDPLIQRTWCNPDFEREEALLERVVVDGTLQEQGRLGGDGGPAVASYLIAGESALPLTSLPDEFAYSAGTVQGKELERGVYTAASGPHSDCTITVKVEPVPAGNQATFAVRCQAG